LVSKGCATACRITDDVIDALQHCRLKAFYKLGGEVGSRCGYENLLIERRVNAQRKAIEKIRRECSETDVATHLDLSVAILRKELHLSLALVGMMNAIRSSSMRSAGPRVPQCSETFDINP
jgi:hypothetical protein